MQPWVIALAEPDRNISLAVSEVDDFIRGVQRDQQLGVLTRSRTLPSCSRRSPKVASKLMKNSRTMGASVAPAAVRRNALPRSNNCTPQSASRCLSW